MFIQVKIYSSTKTIVQRSLMNRIPHMLLSMLLR